MAGALPHHSGRLGTPDEPAIEALIPSSAPAHFPRPSNSSPPLACARAPTHHTHQCHPWLGPLVAFFHLNQSQNHRPPIVTSSSSSAANRLRREFFARHEVVLAQNQRRYSHSPPPRLDTGPPTPRIPSPLPQPSLVSILRSPSPPLILPPPSLSNSRASSPSLVLPPFLCTL